MDTLTTDRLILRDFTQLDKDDLYAYACDPDVGPMAGWKPHASVEESSKVIDMFIESGEVWAIVEKESNRVIGSLGLHNSKKAAMLPDCRELGYVLGKAYWGRGIVAEAARAAMSYGFDALNLKTIMVSHFPFNTQSKRVIEKLGFKYAYHLDASWTRYDGVVFDEEVYLLDK